MPSQARHLNAVPDPGHPADDNGPRIERHILGTAMESPRDLTAMRIAITADAFADPRHAAIWTMICEAADAGEPVNATAVTERLIRAGMIGRLPHPAYTFDLYQQALPGQGGHWARLLAERHTWRNVQTDAARLNQAVQQPGATLEQITDLAQNVIATSNASTVGAEEGTHVAQLAEDYINGYLTYGTTPAIATPWPDLNQLLTSEGFEPSQVVTFGGGPGMGKALALDTALPTPDGWTTMGNVQPGDFLIAVDGKPTRVLAATDVLLDRPCYEIRFSDGTVVVADAQHQWAIESRSGHGRHVEAVRTTEQIAASVRAASGHVNHAVRVCGPFELPKVDLPLSPYALGVWLGRGTTAGTVKGILRSLDVIENKHIPAVYLRASQAQRRALLAGLLDTHGSVADNGTSVRLAVTSKRLAEDTHELILSLGYRCAITTTRVLGKTEASNIRYRLTFSPSEIVFRLPRKASRQTLSQTRHARRRYITDVRSIPSVPVRCVEVDAADHLYLASKSCIPTHNSIALTDCARHIGVELQTPTIFFTLEMTEDQVLCRILAGLTGIPEAAIKRRELSGNELARVDHARERFKNAPLWIISGTFTVTRMANIRRQYESRHGPVRNMIVDYAQIIPAERRRERRDLEVSDNMQRLKRIALDEKILVVTAAQINRGPAQRPDKRPVLADLRESGEIENSSDVVILLHRDDYYDKESPRAGEADFIVAKQRGGATNTITVAAQFHLTRFVSMAWTPSRSV